MDLKKLRFPSAYVNSLAFDLEQIARKKRHRRAGRLAHRHCKQRVMCNVGGPYKSMLDCAQTLGLRYEAVRSAMRRGSTMRGNVRVWWEEASEPKLKLNGRPKKRHKDGSLFTHGHT